MTADLQKANITKRVAAAMLDFILLTVLVTGVAALLVGILDLGNHAEIMDERQKHFAAEFGVMFDISAEDYEKLTEAEKEKYEEAYTALINDQDFIQAYNMQISITMIITTFSILIGILVVEFFIPLWLKNGQTVGKKVFGLALVRIDGVQLTSLQLFVRSVLGKFTIETMIPVYIIILIFFNAATLISLAILAGLFISQAICLIVSKTNSAIHDHLAGTVVVDFASQRIFRTSDDLLEYTKKIHADRANRSDYK